MSAIDRLRDGYTAGASDPSAAHAEFDRLVRAVGLDSDHAAALEREAIAAFIAAGAPGVTRYRGMQSAADAIATAIRNGEHWKEGR